MAIRDERTSTDEILRDSRFHRAALTADPKAHHLVSPVAKTEAELKKRRAATEEAEEKRIDALAVLLRTDFELDERLRAMELQVLGAVDKHRSASAYRAVFPHGLSSILVLRGDEEAREVRVLLPNLKEQFPEIDKLHGPELERLAAASVDAEKAWKDAETTAAHVFANEVIARTELVHQLQKNEGALASLHPGQRRRVRSYFRPTRRRSAVHDDGPAEPTGARGEG